MDEINYIKNLSLSVKDITFICSGLELLSNFYSQSRQFKYDCEYCDKLRKKLSIFKS